MVMTYFVMGNTICLIGRYHNAKRSWEKILDEQPTGDDVGIGCPVGGKGEGVVRQGALCATSVTWRRGSNMENST